MKKKNDDIKSQNDYLKTEIVKLKRELENACDEVKILMKKKATLAKENQDFREINETLVEDVTDLSEKFRHLIPGHLEDEIDELKESNAILKAIIQMNNQDNENDVENVADEDPSNFIEPNGTNPTTDTKNFSCNQCTFSSTSQSGLNVRWSQTQRRSSLDVARYLLIVSHRPVVAGFVNVLRL